MRYIMRTHPDIAQYPHRQACLAAAREIIPDLETVSVLGDLTSFLAVCERAGDDPFVHLEDDIDFCDHFLQHLTTEIEARPNTTIAVFSRRRDDLVKGSRWVGGFEPWFICMYFPAGYGRRLHEYYDDLRRRGDHTHYRNRPLDTGSDVFFCRYMIEHRLSTWLVVPSLVDHLPGQSTIGSRPFRRQSVTFIKHRPPPRKARIDPHVQS